MKPLKVCQMIDRAILGGGQRNLLALAEGLDRSEFEVAVCAQGEGPLGELLKERGIPHLVVPFAHRPSRGVLNRLERLLREYRFDIVHTHGGDAGLHGRWAAHRAGIPVLIHTYHGIHFLHSRNPFTRALQIRWERRLSRFTHATVAVSDFVAGQCRRYRLVPESKLEVIKNGIDFERPIPPLSVSSQRQAEDMGLTSAGPWIGSVARLDPVKGLDILLQAAPQVLDRVPDARFVIVGQGRDGKRLKKLAEGLGLEQRVYFVGERSDALAWMSHFDIFTLPSRHEAFPYTILEAAALRKAVAASAAGGIGEQIQDGRTGLLVKPGDVDELAAALIKLAENRSLRERLGEALRESLAPQYTRSRMLREMQALYLRLHQP